MTACHSSAGKPQLSDSFVYSHLVWLSAPVIKSSPLDGGNPRSCNRHLPPKPDDSVDNRFFQRFVRLET
ncbi:hypothetical protein SB6413_04558 [Klebsiella pasteurii]|nr:hypothetical protein SB6413_04558 [Klebsiella pasteurii]